MRRSIGRALRYEFWYKPKPSGILKLSYLSPWLPRLWALHRQLWWHNHRSRPRLVFLGIELWAWFRFAAFLLWVAIFRLLIAAGRVPTQDDASTESEPPVSALKRWGVSRWQLFVRMAKAGLGYTLLPREAIALRCHVGARVNLEHVLTSEAGGYHLYCNRHYPQYAQSVALLKDKFALAKVLRQLGVPMVPTLQVVESGEEISQSQLLAMGQSLFLKACSLSGAVGSLAFVRENANVVIHTATGQRLEAESEQAAVIKRLCHLDSVLIQPLLQVHPLLQAVCPYPHVATLRVITDVREPCRVRVAILEVPWINPRGKFHHMFKVNIATGEVDLDWIPPHASDDYQQTVQAVKRDLGSALVLPYFSEMLAMSVRAHTGIGAIRFIAWDWVITAHGPLCLEGNSGWGVDFVQSAYGGFLAVDSPFNPALAN
jgi:Sugar-transfer associated ATP-grasp